MNNKNTELMEKAPVNKAILKLAFPTMLTMAVIMILSFFREMHKLHIEHSVCKVPIGNTAYAELQPAG